MERFEADNRIAWKTGHPVREIESDSVVAVAEVGTESRCAADAVVLAVGHETNDGIADELRELPVAVYVVGDARESRNIYQATTEGTDVGLSIGSRDPLVSPRFD